MKGHSYRAAAVVVCTAAALMSTYPATVADAVTNAHAMAEYPTIPPGPIKVGVSTSLSGVSASYGALIEAGVRVAIQQFNQMHPHGILGHEFELDLVNDQSTVTGAVFAADKLVSDGVAATIYLTDNPDGEEQQLDVMAKAKMPVISDLLSLPNGNVQQLSKQFPYDFSPNPAGVQYQTNAGKWIQKKGYKRVAFMNDGIQGDVQAQNNIEAGMKQVKGNAKNVGTVDISPGAVDDSAAIAKLKGMNPDLLVVSVGVGYGPIWQAMQSASFSPDILANPGAWYNGFQSMGSLANNAYAFYYNCAPSVNTTFTPQQTELMQAYSNGMHFPEYVNYLTAIATSSVPLEMLSYAATKEHSIAPDAIKVALEHVTNKKFLGLTYTFTSSNHFGIKAPYNSAVCKMAPPYASGVGKVPVQAKS